MGSRKGMEKQKVNLEYLSVPENKQVLEQMMGKGTPLVVLWLRICLPMEGIQVRSLVWELRSHMSQGN